MGTTAWKGVGFPPRLRLFIPRFPGDLEMLGRSKPFKTRALKRTSTFFLSVARSCFPQPTRSVPCPTLRCFSVNQAARMKCPGCLDAAGIVWRLLHVARFHSWPQAEAGGLLWRQSKDWVVYTGRWIGRGVNCVSIHGWNSDEKTTSPSGSSCCVFLVPAPLN